MICLLEDKEFQSVEEEWLFIHHINVGSAAEFPEVPALFEHVCSRSFEFLVLTSYHLKTIKSASKIHYLSVLILIIYSAFQLIYYIEFVEKRWLIFPFLHEGNCKAPYLRQDPEHVDATYLGNVFQLSSIKLLYPPKS